MASVQSSSVADAMANLHEDGFIFVKDAEAGDRVEEMETRSIPPASEQGLEFYRINVLDDPRKRNLLDSTFEWFGLGLYRWFGAMPGDYAFRQSDLGTGIESLVIQFWRKGSKVTFWKGSHLENVTTTRGENNLWRAPRVALTRLGLIPFDVTFEDGGFSLRDTRVFVEVSKGSAITFAIASKEVLEKWWVPMKLPRSLENVVDRMAGHNCGMNVEYFDIKQNT